MGGKRGGDECGIGMLIAGEEEGGGNGGTDMEGGAASDAVDGEEEVGEIEGGPTIVPAMEDGGDVWSGKIADDPVPVTGGAKIVVVKGIGGGP